jgi:S-(hydroxymethyl)glutathione dehydrogenase/alcohol dehydrogenase
MKAAVVNSITGTFDIEQIDIGDPIANEVLVEVKACGLCHSDLHFAENDFGIPTPFVVGHEMSGVVIGLGPDATEFALGDHVVGSLVQFCGDCASCSDGRTYQCRNPQSTARQPGEASRLTRGGEPVFSGFSMGGFAEYVLIHENQLVKIPDEIPFAEAALIGCSTITGAGAAINTAGVRPGDTVAVIGLGGVGLNVISGARLAGAARIIAVDLQPAKLELAKKFGATDVINSGEVDAVAAVQALTDGGVDHSFEVIGLKVTSEQAIQMARVGGGAYLIGIHKPGSSIDLDVMSLLGSQRKVQGVYMGSTNIKQDVPYYANLFVQGRLNLSDLISKEINIHEINDAYAELKNGSIARSVITSF